MYWMGEVAWLSNANVPYVLKKAGDVAWFSKQNVPMNYSKDE